MSNNSPKTIQILREHTPAGSLTLAWEAIADNFWTLLRSSWPLLAAAAVVGVATPLLLNPGHLSTAAAVTAATLHLVLAVLWLLHAAALLHNYARCQTFNLAFASKPWLAELRTAMAALPSLLAATLLMPRRWPRNIAVTLVALLTALLPTMLLGAPLIISTAASLLAHNAFAAGDAPLLSSSLASAFAAASALATPALCLAAWTFIFPLVFEAAANKSVRSEKK